jgi:hypothetical protein
MRMSLFCRHSLGCDSQLWLVCNVSANVFNCLVCVIHLALCIHIESIGISHKELVNKLKYILCIDSVIECIYTQMHIVIPIFPRLSGTVPVNRLTKMCLLTPNTVVC